MTATTNKTNTVGITNTLARVRLCSNLCNKRVIGVTSDAFGLMAVVIASFPCSSKWCCNWIS